MAFHVGFVGYLALRLFEHPDRADRVAALLVDDRWPWRPNWAQFARMGVLVKRERARKVTGAKGRAVLRDGICNPELRMLGMHRSLSSDADDFANVMVETGQWLYAPYFEQPFLCHGMTRGHELPDGADLGRWIELVHELMVALDVAHAILPVWPTMPEMLSDLTFISIIADSRWAPPKDLGPPPSFAAQIDLASRWRHKLGREYVRHPRWGTYLRRAHLDQVGGLERIRAAVPLARIVELDGGELVFLQCTEHPKTALTADGERVRRALEEVLAPIIVPAWPGPQEAPAS